MESIDKLSWL